MRLLCRILRHPHGRREMLIGRLQVVPVGHLRGVAEPAADDVQRKLGLELRLP